MERSKYLYIDREINDAKSAFETIFKDNENAGRFFEVASLLRLIYHYNLSQDSSLPPLRSAQENNLTFKIGQNLYLCPITESFRRHIIFGTDNSGKIIFKFEVVMPGQQKDRRDPYVNDRYLIAQNILNSYPGNGYCVKPLGEPIRYPNGVYNFYGDKVEFNDECPLRVLAFEYEDGKRLLNMTDSMFNELAKKLSMDRKRLDSIIIDRVAELTAATHALGYIGHMHLGKGDTHYDHHLENFRIIVNDNGEVNITLVGDFGVFQKENEFIYPRHERQYDVRQIILKCGSYNGLSSLIPTCTLARFMPIYNRYFSRFRTTANIQELPAAEAAEGEKAVPSENVPEATEVTQDVVPGVSRDRTFAETMLKKPAATEIIESEVEDALTDINKKMQETVFEQEYITKIARKISNMGLVRGRRVLVVGPADNDFMSVALARLGMKVSAIDIEASSVESQRRLNSRFNLENVINTVSSYDELGDEKFDYIIALGVINAIINPLLDKNIMRYVKIESAQRRFGMMHDAATRYCENKLLKFIATLIPHLNLKGGYLIFNADVSRIAVEQCRIMPQSVPLLSRYFYYMGEALKIYGGSSDLRFIEQRIDVDDVSLNQDFVGEERAGVVYKVEANQPQPEPTISTVSIEPVKSILTTVNTPVVEPYQPPTPNIAKLPGPSIMGEEITTPTSVAQQPTSDDEGLQTSNEITPLTGRGPSTDKAEAARIHTENLKYTPTIPEKTILCHIITDSILPDGQRNVLQMLEQDMRDNSYAEKVVCLSNTNPADFIKEVRTLMARQRELYKDYTVKFDVACPSTDLVVAILNSGLGVKALAFEPCKEDAQLEGIIMALRALGNDNLDSLQKAFEFLSGNKIDLAKLGITSIDEFVKRVAFILPTAKEINYEDRRRLNDIIRENVKTAA